MAFKFKSKLKKVEKPGLLKELLTFNPIKRDDFLFRIHYKLSVLIICFTMIVYGKTIFKYGVLSCIFPSGGGGGMDSTYMDTRCFVSSLYVVEGDDRDGPSGNIISSGSQSSYDFEELNINKKVRYDKYYQFTPFILLIQIIIFNIPQFFWGWYEGGKIEMLCKGLDGTVLDKENVEYRQKKKQVAEYFVACLGFNNLYAGLVRVNVYFQSCTKRHIRRSGGRWFMKLFAHAVCELLNLVGVLFQIYILDVITGNAFSAHGMESFKYAMGGQKDDPFNQHFPTLARCIFNQYGPSGNIVPHSGVCSMPLNLVTKVYFASFWIYLMVLTILDGINMLYRIATMTSFQLRLRTLKDCAIVRKAELRFVLKSCMYGDWFILVLLAKNVAPQVFSEILVDIINELQEHKCHI